MQLRSLASSVCAFVALLFAVGLLQDTVAQSTTVRPYKFGFTIDKHAQQHRKEERDERGIVMGEFGFITADGIYHVTVYATDEEGKFRILAMRNYPYESPPKTIDMIVTPKKKPATVASTTLAPAPPAPARTDLPKYNFNTQGCAGCFLKKTPVVEPAAAAPASEKGPKTDIRALSRPLESGSTSPTTATTPKVPAIVSGTGAGGATPGRDAVNTATDIAQTTTGNVPEFDLRYDIEPRFGESPPTTTSTRTNINATPPKPSGLPQTARTPSVAIGAKPKSAVVGSGGTSPQVPAVVGGAAAGGSGKSGSGVGVSGGSGGAVAGEPGDLYRFKYILDYNGHTETGSRNGNKQGNYYAIGDDNVERTIEYVANEFGYQPRIRWRKLGANEIPKTKENTLKDYEFVWFKQK